MGKAPFEMVKYFCYCIAKGNAPGRLRFIVAKKRSIREKEADYVRQFWRRARKSPLVSDTLTRRQVIGFCYSTNDISGAITFFSNLALCILAQLQIFKNFLVIYFGHCFAPSANIE